MDSPLSFTIRPNLIKEGHLWRRTRWRRPKMNRARVKQMKMIAIQITRKLLPSDESNLGREMSKARVGEESMRYGESAEMKWWVTMRQIFTKMIALSALLSLLLLSNPVPSFTGAVTDISKPTSWPKPETLDTTGRETVTGDATNGGLTKKCLHPPARDVTRPSSKLPSSSF